MLITVLRPTRNAFLYYNEIFADVFIAVVDDWGCPWIRGPTFKAFAKLNYEILYEDVIFKRMIIANMLDSDPEREGIEGSKNLPRQERSSFV